MKRKCVAAVVECTMATCLLKLHLRTSIDIAIHFFKLLLFFQIFEDLFNMCVLLIFVSVFKVGSHV